MMSSEDNEERILHALVGIGAELTRIRRLLERDIDTEPAEHGETLTCRSCGATFTTADAAHRHARNEHGAPVGDGTDIII